MNASCVVIFPHGNRSCIAIYGVKVVEYHPGVLSRFNTVAKYYSSTSVLSHFDTVAKCYSRTSVLLRFAAR